MTDVAGQFGAVERVEMQMLDAVFHQGAAKFRGNSRGQKLFAVVAHGLVKCVAQPGRNGRTTGLGKATRACPVFDGQDAGNDGRVDPRLGAGIPEAKEGFCFKEKLRDRFGCTCIYFAFEPIYVGLLAGRLGVFFGVGPDAYVELPVSASAEMSSQLSANPFGCGSKFAAPFGGSPRRATMSRTPAVAKSCATGKCFFTAGTDASQVGGHVQAAGLVQCGHRIACEFTCRAARAICDGHKPRG